MKRILIAAALLAAVLPSAQAATYKIDASHSSVLFKVRHLIGKVSGRFDKFEGSFNYDPKDAKSWKTSATIDASSINTNMDKRDAHLRGADFFDVAKLPTLSFVSTKVSGLNGDKAKLAGNLTIHGVTKPVVLDLEILGAGKDPWGNQRASFTATTKIDRKEYGLTWNETLETGGVLVGEEVEITLEIEGIQQ